MRGRMTLTQFMDALREEGVIGDEYEARVAEFIERRQSEQDGSVAMVPRSGSGAIEQRPDPSMIPFPTSAQDSLRTQRARIPVDYGDETVEEARERWTQQEIEDPDGVLGMGGATAGGIFGDGAIATDRYDPAARGRAAPIVGAKTQLATLEVLRELQAELRESREENRLLREERERGRLGPSRGRRLLGGKKR